jgi:hypothetical protein
MSDKVMMTLITAITKHLNYPVWVPDEEGEGEKPVYVDHDEALDVICGYLAKVAKDKLVPK